jgi:glycosyltransferase involved in cell wall biosynthesis
MANRILHLVKDFSPPSQTFIYDLIHSLEKNSSDSLHVVGYYRKRLLAEQRRCREVISLTKRRDILGRMMSLLHFKGNVSRERSSYLSKLIQKFNPQVIHAHFAWTVWDLLIPYTQFHHLDIPVLVSVHGTDLLKTAKQSEEKRQSLVHFSECFQTKFTVSNRFMAEELAGIGVSETKICTVPNSISNIFINKNSEQKIIPRLKDNVYRIACVGRLVHCKGQKYLIEAVSRLVKEAEVCCELTLVGNGTERKNLERLVKDLQIEDTIRFEGFIDHTKIPETLRSQDIYVQPSIYDEATGQCEAFGISVLEAISCGLPVIVSQSGGMPDVIGKENECARLVKPADSGELYLALLDFYKSKVFMKDNSAYAKERLELFSKKRQINEIQSAYASLLTM